VRADYLVGVTAPRAGFVASSASHDRAPALNQLRAGAFPLVGSGNRHALGQFWHLFLTTGTTVIAQDEWIPGRLHVNPGPG